jgi:ATP/maltotriose-dependent transcriptional regulator MalT
MSRWFIDGESGVDVGVIARRPEPLYGRDDELSALRAALANARAGRGRLILVAGGAGIGKTSLIESAIAEARATGSVVLGGHCYDFDTAAPYEPWIDALRSYDAGDDLPCLPPGLGNAELLETLAGKDALFEQLAAFLGELSAVRPALLTLEDLHWSDQASLDLLRAVARRLPTWRLLIVATFRDDELTPRQPLHRVLPLLVREARPLRLDLRPLDEHAVRALAAVRYRLPPAEEARLVAHLQHYAEGNPFYIEELLRTLEHERLVQPNGDGWAVADLALAPVPPLVRQLIDDRAARLGQSTRLLLQVGSVIGLVGTPELLQSAAELDDDTFADAVEEARQAHLLDETPERAALRFTHALIREALYNQISLPRRRAWHRRIGELLAERPRADPDAVAHHLLQAGDERASDWLIRAGQRAERRDASWDAVARYEQALPLLEAHGSADSLAWLHADLAESYRYIDPSRSSAHLDAAERTAHGTNDPTLALTVRWLRTRLRGFLGQGVITELRECVAALETMSAAERDRIARMGRLNLPSRGLLAQWIAFHGRYDEAIAHAEAVLASETLPESEAQTNERGGALIALGLAHAGLGRADEARTAFAAAGEQFRAIGSAFMTASTLKWEAIEVAMAYAADDLEGRQRLLEEYTRTMSSLSSFAVFLGARPLLQVFGPALLEGRWADVRESALAYLHVPAWRVSALAALGDLERRQGRLSTAWGRVRSGIPGGVETPPGNLYFVDALALQRLAADIALDEGRPEAALPWLEAHDRWLAWSGRLLDRPAALLLWARYHAALGDRDRAATEARRALDRATEPRQPLALLAAHRALGALAAASGAVVEAEPHFETALALADACAAPFERALTLLEQAESLAAHDRLAAAPALEEAQATFTRLGAAPALARLATLETRRGAEPAPPAPGGLSPREVEVLRLVAQGLSYADVGDRLFISPRTVARHLQSIYTKLGVDSRAEAAAFAFEHGLV